MLIAGYYARRFGKRFLMRLSAVAGVLFYVGMLTVHTPALLLAMQVLNAIYIGILAGIGMPLFPGPDAGAGGRGHHPLYQYYPRRLDHCRFTGGVVAEIWSYHAVFWIALAMGVVTQACLWRIRDV
ncbi:sugar efflux transporter B [Klebsiella pneumoniae]|uniref:Sugar efflux transporter B n=1 Tax=Klebsiella pneumoniae TaxID=573 RepID=A0A2X1QG63_KLEPN|nr:sugar efflux transporter B [Klebsiella pneumoniae]